ncbi:MAG: four helix bundle protein [Ferruginibacter sp.]
MSDYKDLVVFQKAHALAMEIFHLTKQFPSEEKFSLIDQIRRSSRSVCVNLGEAYRKRRYPAHFLSKLTDCDAENTETGIWLKFSLDCNYLPNNLYEDLISKNNEVGKLLGYMIQNPGKFL